MSELTLSDCRPEVLAFAILMERELRANDHKPGWKGDAARDLVEHCEREVFELTRAVHAIHQVVVWREQRGMSDRGNGWSRKNPVTGECEVGSHYRSMTGDELAAQRALIAEEAADVANMAMMVADVSRGLPAIKEAA